MYLTFYKPEGPNNRGEPTISFEEFLQQMYTNHRPIYTRMPDSFRRTLTVSVDDNTVLNLQRYPIGIMQRHLISLSQLRPSNPEEMYHSFRIPKHSGGYRQIDAPFPPLMEYLRRVKVFFENELRTLSHDAAFAYIKHRNCKQALQEHQRNNSKWFLKLDIKDFFPSCNLDFIMLQLRQLFPFIHLCQTTEGKMALRKTIQTGLLNDRLPQGTPLSPLLTNLIMIPIDYAIQHKLWEMGHDFCYTRYADDLLISSPYCFVTREVTDAITDIFRTQATPFELNEEKTRYGSTAGRNWNLGLMLNKDNNITVGHKRKEQLRAAIHNFLRDYNNGVIWDRWDVQHMVGELAYLRAIEPEAAEALVRKLEDKQRVNLRDSVKYVLNS